MPNRWFHESVDICTWGKSYWWIHKSKDAAYRTLGRRHREVGHPWYRRFQIDWTLDNPFPRTLQTKTRQIMTSRGGDAAERFQAAVTHDYFDRWWNPLTRSDRIQIAEGFRRLMLEPDTLREWAGVDVIRGLVKRSRDVEQGLLLNPTWELETSLPSTYQRLRSYLVRTPISDLV